MVAIVFGYRVRNRQYYTIYGCGQILTLTSSLAFPCGCTGHRCKPPILQGIAHSLQMAKDGDAGAIVYLLKSRITQQGYMQGQ
jgi:hypothetical protein